MKLYILQQNPKSLNSKQSVINQRNHDNLQFFISIAINHFNSYIMSGL